MLDTEVKALGTRAKAQSYHHPRIHPADADFERAARRMVAEAHDRESRAGRSDTKTFFQRKAALSALHAYQKVPYANAMLHTSIMWWRQHARLLYTFQAQNHLYALEYMSRK